MDEDVLPLPRGAPYKYDVFISYRRADAAALARWIRDRLQQYKLSLEVLEALSPEKKAVHERRPTVWLDRACEKSSDGFLIKKIYPALDASARLLVVSTASAFHMIPHKGGIEEPNWLMREIDRYLGAATAVTTMRPVDVVVGPWWPGGPLPRTTQ